MDSGYYRTPKIERSSNRAFGGTMALFFAIIGVLPLYSEHKVHNWALLVSGIVLLLTLFVPRRLWRLNQMWMQLGLFISMIVSPIAMGIVFFAAITPFGLVMRLLGKDLMPLRFNSKTESYWTPRQPTGPDPKTMKNLF